MAKWREREHILNRFPSSVPRCIYVARETSAARPGGCCTYIPPRCSRRGLASSFWARGGEGEVSNLKGLKRFPRRVARRIVGPRTPIDRRLFLAPVALDPLSPLLELPSPRSGCDLLRTFKRSHVALRPREAVPFDARKISGGVKNGADGQRARNTSRLVSSGSRFVTTRAAGIASFVVCDNNFYDAHWLSG